MASTSPLARGPVRLHRRWKADLGDHVIALAWAPGGKTLAAASVAGAVTLYEPAGRPLATLPGHPGGTMVLSWHHTGTRLVTGGQDGLARVWAIESGQEIAAVEAGAAWVEHVLCRPGHDQFVTAAGKKMRLCAVDGTSVRDYPDHPRTISGLAWRPGTGELTTATYGQVALWGAEDGTPTRVLEWKGSILKLAWASSGQFLAHGNQDATVVYWSLASGQELQMAGYPMKVREVTFDATGRFLATGGGEVVTVWDCAPPGPEGGTPLTFEEHRGPVSALTYQFAGPLLASGGLDNQVLLLQPGKFKKSLASSNLGQPVTHLAWSPDDRLLAAGGAGGEVVVYSVAG